MTTYQLKAPTGSYDALDLDDFTLAEQLGNEELVETLMSASMNNTPLSPLWHANIACSYFGNAKAQGYDISISGSFLVLNQTALKVLKPQLESFGEFLPISVEGSTYELFHCLTFGKELKSLFCLTRDLEGVEDGIDSLIFDESDVQDKLIFKSKLQGASAFYCNDALKALLGEHSLSGITFDEELLEPF
ncbi:hypothetical protein F9L16_23720 [Agarivorans sp. B2Z047]|uniref:hypothetical protein n=1 Tax=Agarivorans sp. B2Z047 TaxID=2652721 RepID=UPI00128D21CA|nr:hypothetical protein [Agarivorans sp. B2Z047]MPW31964.1 hypothetical protein [Agarivorans sp. B2Z047]UQN41973.1 hypothetical protein LQZ07_19695 [Agarivorans sp. B2Z047]